LFRKSTAAMVGVRPCQPYTADLKIWRAPGFSPSPLNGERAGVRGENSRWLPLFRDPSLRELRIITA
jgi:hypothetical protein